MANKYIKNITLHFDCSLFSDKKNTTISATKAKIRANPSGTR